MKKLLTIIAIALGAVSCYAPFGELENIADVPGVEPGKGNRYDKYTTYKGALLPDPEFCDRDRMVELLELIGKQKDEIDDTAFIDQLTKKVFDCVDRYMYIHDPDEAHDRWSDAGEWVGGRMYYDLVMYDNGEFALRHDPPMTGESVQWLYEAGYKGWHSMGVWEYDYESNTLYTSEDKSYAAKVLYFDGEFAVLEGLVYPMWLYNPAEFDYERTTPMELYGFKFSDGKEDYLDGFELTAEESSALKKQWYEENMFFEGKELPHEGACECFKLLGKQQPEEIGDDYVIKVITDRRLECKTRYVTTDDYDRWTYQICEYDEVVGEVTSFSDMVGNVDGTYLTRVTINPCNDNYKQAQTDKYYGWYRDGQWSYDADSNTLTMTIEGNEYKATVVYLDIAKSRIILRGKTGFLYDGGYDDEILDCTYYEDGIDNYLDGYVTYDKLVEYLQGL
ncbi:MAG: hypothetical protein UHS52_06645 [Alistipes sp.]|nr:hypothetical protein [Alistipes sp.]